MTVGVDRKRRWTYPDRRYDQVTTRYGMRWKAARLIAAANSSPDNITRLVATLWCIEKVIRRHQEIRADTRTRNSLQTNLEALATALEGAAGLMAKDHLIDYVRRNSHPSPVSFDIDNLSLAPHLVGLAARTREAIRHIPEGQGGGTYFESISLSPKAIAALSVVLLWGVSRAVVAVFPRVAGENVLISAETVRDFAPGKRNDRAIDAARWLVGASTGNPPDLSNGNGGWEDVFAKIKDPAEASRAYANARIEVLSIIVRGMGVEFSFG